MRDNEKPVFSKRSTWKEPTFREQIFMWISGVIKIRRWERIDIDEFLSIVSLRKDIEEKLENENLDERMKENLFEADENFRKLTKETEKSVFELEGSNLPKTKEKYWFSYRLLESKYDDWLLYASF